MFFSKSENGLEALLRRPPPSNGWQKFLEVPCLYLARLIYERTLLLHRIILPKNPITVVCVSDTHNTLPEIPHGDILIHAGDATQAGTLKELQATIDWLDTFPHKHRIMIAGNHELLLDPQATGTNFKDRALINWRSITYLENEAIKLGCPGGRQIQIYGSPLTPKHGNWAFQYPRSRDVLRGTVPEGTDILVTHGPPRSHLDLGKGCEFLLGELWRVRPRLHVFGHIHAGYGTEWMAFDDSERLFESMSREGGGWVKLLLLCYKSVAACFGVRRTASTQLVNAAIVGGIRDEERRPAVTVIV